MKLKLKLAVLVVIFLALTKILILTPISALMVLMVLAFVWFLEVIAHRCWRTLAEKRKKDADIFYIIHLASLAIFVSSCALITISQPVVGLQTKIILGVIMSVSYIAPVILLVLTDFMIFSSGKIHEECG